MFIFIIQHLPYKEKLSLIKTKKDRARPMCVLSQLKQRYGRSQRAIDLLAAVVQCAGAFRTEIHMTSFGATPLFIASQESHLEMVRLLCEAGADKNKADGDGATPLLAAVTSDRSAWQRFVDMVDDDPKRTLFVTYDMGFPKEQPFTGKTPEAKIGIQGQGEVGTASINFRTSLAVERRRSTVSAFERPSRGPVY